jgi:carbamoyl-phosphate synthase large subunit
MKILVTGIAGDIGYGIGRILKESGITEHLVGCDIHNEHPGELVFNSCDVIEKADSEQYIESLISVAKRHYVDLIIPTSEPELRFLLREKMLDNVEGIPLLMANEKALLVGFDKLNTARFLESAGLLHPWTKIVSEGQPDSMPCIIKSRVGAGGKDVSLVQSELVELYSRTRPNDIWQEYLQPDDQEFTCGVYRSSDKKIRTIIFKRKLNAGITVYGEVVENGQIEKLLAGVAKELNLIGSINVQLRLTERGPIIFEINPRFSSTVVFRHLIGFEDLIWSINNKFGQPIANYMEPKVGKKFYRGTSEIFLES